MKHKSILETTMNTPQDKHSNKKQNKRRLRIEPTRRELLIWTAPVIASISLPVHAQMSICPPTTPVLTALTPAKCAGASPILGEAALAIFSSGSIPLDIISVTDNAINPNAIAYSSTSGIVTDTDGIDVDWDGPSTDATTCLPTEDVDITVTYTCSNDPMTYTDVFSVLDILADAVP